MFFKIPDDLEKYYRGSIPFLMMNLKNKGMIYISTSNRNLDDYFFVLNDFYDGKVMKMEKLNISEEEKKGKKQKLLEWLEKDEKFIILMSLASAVDNYTDTKEKLTLDKGIIKNPNEILTFLEEKNYKRNYLIEKRGEYSKRGDILDIFPVNEEEPIRIEFFDDEIEKIKYFDINSQKSVEEIKTIDIFTNSIEDESKSLLDLIKNKKIELFLENNELSDYKLEELILFYKENEERIRSNYEKLNEKVKKIELKSFKNKEIDEFKKEEYIKKSIEEDKILLLTEEIKRNREIYGEKIEIEEYPYFEGFRLEDRLVLTDRELKGIRVKRVEQARESLKLNNINQIKSGEYIIHDSFGVGIFGGIEVLDNSDYIKIKYADRDRLYVPIEHINRIEKYLTDSEKEPVIYKLGIRGFRKKKKKLQEDIIEYALELIKTQATRNLKNGYSFSEDTVWQEEFEEGFIYRETKDQMKAIIDVKRDMESYKVMDRIVCGDVGYGKTEVALRAAFKAVMDGKQVAILAPTTVLVNQHYKTFLDRMKNFPVEIEIMSRLVKNKSQSEILKKLKTGFLDIIIGTHRLISKDIKFNDLGLLIVDEEQKFGVNAKEQLKRYKNNVDILTLTATPIPRTLNMALLGIKDISLIESPPENRKSIETQILVEDENVIKKAILREIARDGQVFYLFNRVIGIKEKLEKLEKILPEYVKVDFIHGRLSGTEIKEKLEEFEAGRIDVLLTTTIIENGIDIENANTIIIEDFNKLGLAQIYQIRGRVGRSNKKAYCYLTYKNKKTVTKLGQKKIERIKEIQDMGAGYQLSLEDMKIRGAGEILGAKQHGAIKVLGYDMYLKMLNDEINKIKSGKNNESEVKKVNEELVGNENQEELKIELKEKGFIPKTYINEEEKIRIYKRLIMIEELDELKELKMELEDRFGKMPEVTKKLFYFWEIKILSKKVNVKNIKEKEEYYEIKFFTKNLDINKINMLLLEGEAKYISETQSLRVAKIKQLKRFLTKIL